MSINEQIVTGRKFRKLIDEASRLWLRVSFWTKASDVEFDDGEDAETKFSNIQVIINNLRESFNNFKESVQSSLNNIHNNLGGNRLIYNESENRYYIQHGADSALKKLGSSEEDIHIYSSTYNFVYPNSSSGIITLNMPIDTNMYKVLKCGISNVSMARLWEDDDMKSGRYQVTSGVSISYTQQNLTISYSHASQLALEIQDPPCTVSYFIVYIEK